ncbi:MAG: amino acid adenylation domain-containing protein [Acidobacteriota bacterium]|nr:amino acid adenylation domain-containing protein [Acidobacteriota bacterium]
MDQSLVTFDRADAEALVLQLSKKGVKLRAEDGKLRLRAPKDALSDQEKQLLKQHKQTVLDYLKGTAASDRETIQTAPVTDTYPLSQAQQRLWFLDRMDPDNTAYNVGRALLLEGRLNTAALETALGQLLQRHTILSTAFGEVDGTPFQRPGVHTGVDLEVTDISMFDRDVQKTEIADRTRRVNHTPFHLTTDPPMRTHLLKRGEDSHVLLLCLHHIVTDGMSMSLLVRELTALYRAADQGAAASLPQPELQYTDFAVWEQGALQKGLWENRRGFWQNALRDVPQKLNLPYDYPAPPHITYSGAAVDFSLNKETADAARRLAADTGATLFMTLLAGYGAVLGRICSQNHLLVGTTVAGRNRVELEAIMGFFINTLALEIDIRENPTLTELVHRVRRFTTDAFANGDFPTDQLIACTNADRDPSTTPLVQCAFTLQNFRRETVDLEGLKLTPMEEEEAGAKVALTLLMNEMPDGSIEGTLQYNADLFEPIRIQRMAQQLTAFWETAAGNEAETVTSLLDRARVEAQPAADTFKAGLADLRRKSNMSDLELTAWVGSRLNTTSIAYEEWGYVTYPYEIDLDRFHRVNQMLVEKLDTLRLNYIADENGIPQRVDNPNVLNQPLYRDFSGEEDPLASMHDWIQEIYRDGLKLDERLFDFSLARLGENSYAHIMRVHILCMDGMSMAHCWELFSDLYFEDREAPRETWSQRSHADEDRNRRGEEDWHREQKWIESVLAVPWEPSPFHGRLQKKTGTKAFRLTREPDRDLVQQTLAGLKDQNPRYLFYFLLAVLTVYLHRSTGSRVVSIGLPLHNRRSKAARKAIGSLSHILPLRFNVDPDETLQQLIDRIGDEAFKVLKNGRAVPLVGRVAYDTVLNFFPPNTLYAKIRGDYQPTVWVFARHMLESLTLQVVMGGNHEVEIHFDLHEEVFNAEQGRQASELFFQTWRSCLTAGDTPVRGLCMLPENDARMVADLADVPPPLCADVLTALKQHVRERPEAIALYDGAANAADGALSYRQLDRLTDTIARNLRARGVGPETPAAVLLERSPRFIAVMLGIFKAGGVFLPLDPDYPAERIARIVDDAQPVLLIAQSNLVSLAPEGVHICDPEELCRATENDDIELSALEAQQAAYIIYTSGSTGRPKGVVISRQSLNNFAEHCRRTYQLTHRDRVLQFAALGFDTAMEEIVPTLVAGGAVITRNDDILTNAGQFLDFCRRWNITVIDLPTAFWRRLTAEMLEGNLSFPAETRLTIIGGEAALPETCQQWFQLNEPRPLLLNTYGPTEATVVATQYTVESGDGNEVSIGRPIAGYGVQVRDDDDQPTAACVPGSLLLTGAGLARGYLNRPAETALRFRPDPNGQGTRRYVSGDRARLRPDGNLMFLGRVDNQVKLRGFRIEPGEIEIALEAVEGISRAVVSLREDAGPGLVGYVCTSQEAVVPRLREAVAAKLPAFMAPSAFICLQQFPLTPNGKIDRKALDALPLPQTHPPAEAEDVLGAGPVEQILLDIWAQVLGAEKAGRDANFFDVGGHSLLAAQVVSRIGASLDLKVPIRQLFETPTPRLLGRALEKQRTGEHFVDEPAPAFRPDRRKPAPLSFAQQRLWFLQQLEGKSSAYNIPSALRLTGSISHRRFRRALEMVVARHESLRTRFAEEDGLPVQIVDPAGVISFPLIDLTDADDPEEQARAFIAREFQSSFDLTQGELYRFTLLKLDVDEHILVLNQHHIISDGWSMGILAGEICAFYADDQEASLPAPALQYPDYAVWQRNLLQGEGLERRLSFWRKTLGGELPVLDLPTDRPRTRVRSHAASVTGIVLDLELSEALRGLSRKQGATLFMTLLAAFKLQLARLSGTDDVIVGTPTAGRNRPELETLIGFFINTLALRTRVKHEEEPAPTFLQLLNRVRTTTLDAYEHQDLPFEKVVEAVKPERDAARNPIYQVFFNMLNLPAMDSELPGLTVQPISNPPAVGTKFDFTLYANDMGEQIGLKLHYNTALFNPERALAMLEQYAGLLQQIAEQPDLSIETYNLTSPSRDPYLPDQGLTLDTSWRGSVPAHIRTIVEKGGGTKLAVCDTAGDWTYAELLQRIEDLARGLIQHGVRKGDVVCIYAAREKGMAVTVPGILNAGAAFAVLDPGYPAARLADYVAACKPRLIVALAGAGAVPEALSGAPVLTLNPDDRLTDIAESTDHAPLPEIGPDDPASVGFTSGSTGKPKVIVGRHGSLTHFLPWSAEHFQLSESDRFSMLSGLAHDPLQRDLFTPLCLGASIIVPAETDIAPHRLAQWAAVNRISVMHLSPAMIGILCDTDAEMSLPHLRKVFFVGEALVFSAVQRLHRRAEQLEVINFYGTTETQRTVSYYRVSREETRETLPLGVGMPGSQILVLRADGRTAGVGELGELVMRSPHMALGFLPSDDSGNQRFSTDPGQADCRRYRTGDLGRYQADGTVVFQGRVDSQVNLRGYRIETAEPAALLLELPEVREVFIDVRGEGNNRALVAWVVAEGSVDLGAWRRLLRSKLPEYMVPGHFIQMDAMPLTPNRKVDRKALPEPKRLQGPERPFVPPRTPSEELVAAVWSEVLERDGIGADDDFFELGGHSLQAARVLARLHETHGVDLPLRTLFDATTVSDLGLVLDQARGGASLPVLQREGGANGTPPSFSQRRLWFLEKLGLSGAAYNMYAAVRFRGALDAAAMEQAFLRLLTRQEELRAYFPGVNGLPLRQLADVDELRPVFLDLQGLENPLQSAEDLARNLVVQRFNVEQGPLIRALVLRLGADDYLVLTLVHHILFDGWSVTLLIRELAEQYTRTCRDPEAAPPAETRIRYADYARTLQAWGEGPAVKEQLAWWREHLRGVPEELHIPLDGKRQIGRAPRGDLLHFQIEAADKTTLEADCRQLGVTPYMLLQAVYAVLLYRLSGQDDVCIGTPVAGRNRKDLEELIGFFVNTLVIRNDLSNDPSFRDFLTRVRTTTLESFSRQELPFEMLVDELQPERAMDRTPFFQTVFVMQNTPETDLTLPGLTAQPFALNQVTPKFDLSLTVRPLGGHYHASFEYNSDLFHRSSVENFASMFQTLLQQVLADTDQPISRLGLMSGETALELPRLLNPISAQHDVTGSLCDRFRAQAQRTPDRIAARDEHLALTYAQLERRTNAAAAQLTARGVRPGDRVGIAAERTLGSVIGILGILKAGATYVPMDAAYPEERADYMIADAGLALVVTESSTAARFGERAVILDLEAEAENGPGVSVSADHPAYVIYTSGSTGKSKGAVLSHRAVLRLFDAAAGRLEFGENDVWTLFHSFAFDFSVWELWGPLLCGGRLVVVPYLTTRSPQQFHQLLKDEGVTVLSQTPSAFYQLAQCSEEKLPALRRVIFGGEALDFNLLADWNRRYGDNGPELVNMYGITETCVHVTYFQVTPERAGRGSLIGLGLDDLEIAVLDRHMRPVPAGVPGELFVGGAGLAQGYLGRPALTAATFTPHPFSATPGARLYRSGDRVRFRRDEHALEYLGRIDFQIKLRGFRIEPGEIEAALTEQNGVDAAMVLLTQAPNGDKRLSAFAVMDETRLPEVTEQLRKALPAYMVPSRFHILDAMPMTPNGKADRRALLAMDSERTEAGGARVRQHVPLQGETEIRLAAIWSDLLGIANPGAEDDFFEVGGNSLTAVPLTAQIEKVFGQKIPLAELFTSPTIRKQARRLGASKPLPGCLVPLSLEGDKAPFFCVHPAGGNVLCYQPLAKNMPKDRPFFGIQSVGIEGETDPLYSVEVMAKVYIEAMRKIQPEGPYHIGGWSLGGMIAFEMGRQLAAANEEVKLLALFDAYPPELLTRPEEDNHFALQFLQDAAAEQGKTWSVTQKDLEHIPAYQRDEHIFNLARKADLLPPEIDLDRWEAISEVVAANGEATFNYRPGPYAGKVTLFRAEQKGANQKDTSPAQGWDAYAEVEVHPQNGTHLTIMTQPDLVKALARDLAQTLDS